MRQRSKAEVEKITSRAINVRRTNTAITGLKKYVAPPLKVGLTDNAAVQRTRSTQRAANRTYSPKEVRSGLDVVDPIIR